VRLTALQPGRMQWAAYQAPCGDVLSFLFCPPLRQQIIESANESRINRRDFVLPNYTTSGFWDFMRTHYHADYVVIDAKNLSFNVKKGRIPPAVKLPVEAWRWLVRPNTDSTSLRSQRRTHATGTVDNSPQANPCAKRR